jgi:hypothetical protein
MKRITAHLSYANATATLALLFALSGGAIAATGGFSSGGKLQACANEEGGLKLLKAGKHCKRGQKTLAWNVTGPAGATGSAGAKGATGAQGAPGTPGTQGKEGQQGPSNGFQVFNDAPGAVSNTSKTVATLAVPSGSYLVTAKLWAVNSSASRIELECQLINDVNGDKDETDVTAEAEGTTSFFGRSTVSLEAASKFGVPGRWLLKCDAFNAPINVEDVKLQAIQVASLSNDPTTTS